MANDNATAASWHALLVEGHEPLRRAQRVFRHLPRPPRCKLCQNPFAGVGGAIVRLGGFRPSRKNPNLCSRCCDTLPPGGLELDIGVLFADVRDSTALCERIGTAAFADRLNTFYRTSTDVLVRHDAIVDKLIGDEVMALFVPGIAGERYRRSAARAALDLVSVLQHDGQLPVGAAVTAGTAYVGNVGSESVVDFTALGDPVNAAARLQAYAGPGEVVLTDDIYRELGEELAGTESRTVTVRGQAARVDVRVVRPPGGQRFR